jgi:energy-coupling factor transport system ATP-binding protein
LTILLITQFPEEALFAQRLLLMDRGQLIMDGPPVEIFQRVDELQRLGLQPPIEFLAHHEFKKSGGEVSSIEDFLLSPIL